MTALFSIQNDLRRLPARVIHALHADKNSREWKLEFAQKIQDLAEERLNNLLWLDVVDNEELSDALETEYDLNPEITPDELTDILVELQPNFLEKAELELENLYRNLIA